MQGLSGDGGSDATTDVTGNEPGPVLGDAAPDVNDGGVEAEAGLCPPNTDPSLVVYFPSDEGSGTVLHDCSGHGYDAMLTGTGAASSWTTGHSGSAVLYVPSDTICAFVGSPAANQSGGPLTVTAWIKPLDPQNGYVVGQRHEVGYAWRTDFEYTDAGPMIAWGIGKAGAGYDDNIFAFVTSGTWHFVAGVFDPTGPTEAMYVDGTKSTFPSPPASIVADPVASTIAMGCRDDGTNYFNGVIDEVRVYSRALSDAEIAALAAQP